MVQSVSWEWLIQGFKIELETQLKPKTVKDYCNHISYFARWAQTNQKDNPCSVIKRDIQEFLHYIATNPAIFSPGGWGDTLPEWLRGAITMERLIENMKALKGGELTGTDAEVCAYLYTASLTAPMDHDWSQIYLYVATQTYMRRGKNQMPADIAVDSISDYQMNELNRLKAWLYRQRSRIRLDREQAERKQSKEEDATRRKAEQPVLFEF